jgi:hypothetical protein
MLNIAKIKSSIYWSLGFISSIFAIEASDSFILIGAIFLLFLMVIPIVSMYINGIYGVLAIALSVFLFAIFDSTTAIFIFFLVLLPGLMISVLMRYSKPFKAGDIVTFLGLYAIISILVINYLYLQDISVYDFIYDKMQFVLITLNSSQVGGLPEAYELEGIVSVLSIFLPGITAVFWVLWAFVNYKFSLFVLQKMKENISANLVLNYYPTKYYNLLFIIIVLITVLMHNFLAKYTNMYYTLYNILLVLWSTYFYLGVHYSWYSVNKIKNILLSVVFAVFLILMFVEAMIILSFVGFLVAINALTYK